MIHNPHLTHPRRGVCEGISSLHVSDLLRANKPLFFFFNSPSWRILQSDPNARKEAVMTSVRNELALANAQELINVRAPPPKKKQYTFFSLTCFTSPPAAPPPIRRLTINRDDASLTHLSFFLGRSNASPQSPHKKTENERKMLRKVRDQTIDITI
jgi:hypothetical protein